MKRGRVCFRVFLFTVRFRIQRHFRFPMMLCHQISMVLQKHLLVARRCNEYFEMILVDFRSFRIIGGFPRCDPSSCEDPFRDIEFRRLVGDP